MGELLPGALFAGKYVIEEVLGRGGMGVVYRANHRRLSQQVAIKVLLPEMLKQPTVVARFEREARASAQLRSRHSVRVMDVGELESGLPYMVMELLDGHDLAAELAARGPLPIGEAVEYVVQACAAVAEAHGRGIVHRDLKPANLFCAKEGDERVIKLLDFGISKLEDATGANATSTQATFGTPLYMSPEQLRSAKDVDGRTDIWALGIILYELLTGRTPFEGIAAAVGAAIVSEEPPPVTQLRPDVPPELERVILRALAKRRDARYASAEELAAALAPWRETASKRNLQVVATDPKLAIPSLDDDVNAKTLTQQRPLPQSVPPSAVTQPHSSQAQTTPISRSPRFALLAVAAVGVVGLGGAAVALGRRGPAPAPTVLVATTSVPSASPVPSATVSTAVSTAAVLPHTPEPAAVDAGAAPSAAVATARPVVVPPRPVMKSSPPAAEGPAVKPPTPPSNPVRL